MNETRERNIYFFIGTDKVFNEPIQNARAVSAFSLDDALVDIERNLGDLKYRYCGSIPLKALAGETKPMGIEGFIAGLKMASAEYVKDKRMKTSLNKIIQSLEKEYETSA